ncbi:MAG: thioesterase family protein [Caulobacterales bacterium]
MKPSADRLDLANYPHKAETPARFSDVDMFRHLNNVAIGQFYEEVRFALIAEAREKIPRERNSQLLVVNVDTAFLRQARYPGMVSTGTGITQRGKRSFMFDQALFQNGVCFSAADTTIVYTENGKTADLPPEFGAMFDALKLPSFVDER